MKRGPEIIRLLKILVIIVLSLGLFLAFLRYIETRTLFYPFKAISIYPREVNLAFEDVYFKTSDNKKINGWFVPAKDAKYTILFCHGNAGNISHRIEKILSFNQLGVSVFIFDYRGYGRSEGSPSEAGLYKDALAAYRYLLSKGITGNQIIGYGESLGGAVIVELSLRNSMRAIILDSTFSSVKDMIQCAYSFVPYWIFSSRFDSEHKIPAIKIPKLIIHSENDEIIPCRLGKSLFEAAVEPKEFLRIHGGHNSCFFESRKLVVDKIRDFIKRL